MMLSFPGRMEFTHEDSQMTAIGDGMLHRIKCALFEIHAKMFAPRRERRARSHTTLLNVEPLQHTAASQYRNTVNWHTNKVIPLVSAEYYVLVSRVSSADTNLLFKFTTLLST